jgi:hypothetical protein
MRVRRLFRQGNCITCCMESRDEKSCLRLEVLFLAAFQTGNPCEYLSVDQRPSDERKKLTFQRKMTGTKNVSMRPHQVPMYWPQVSNNREAGEYLKDVIGSGL